MSRRVQVLVVDDSTVVRQVYRSILEAGGLHVMATANDPFEAVKFISQAVPDVMIVDVEMPRMDGITFLRKVMAQCPIPTVVCSSFTAATSGLAFEAARAGAVEVLEKPADLAINREFSVRLCEAVLTASIARVRAPKNEPVRTSGRFAAGAAVSPRAQSIGKPIVHSPGQRPLESRDSLSRVKVAEPVATRSTVARNAEAAERRVAKSRPQLIAIGASTGGTEAIRRVLATLPERMPPIVIVQHMPAGFTESFAGWLDKCCRISVSEAVDGQTVGVGQAVVAKGGLHLRVRLRQGSIVTLLGDDPPVNLHRPSVDVLFDSVVSEVGARAHGVLLTGMGDDGADGLLRLRQVGALTIAESEESAVVFGMPKEAILRGAASMVLGLDEISTLLGSVQSDEAI
jgi:two-component system chemotaxis response regulator CheB